MNLDRPDARAYLFVEFDHRHVDTNLWLTEVAGIVAVPEPADGHVRRLVKVDRFLLTQKRSIVSGRVGFAAICSISDKR